MNLIIVKNDLQMQAGRHFIVVNMAERVYGNAKATECMETKGDAMSDQEMVLIKQLEEKKRSSSEDFLYLYLKGQQAAGAMPSGKKTESAPH